jgi:ergothioneine biosynthesis protein EgtB
VRGRAALGPSRTHALQDRFLDVRAATEALVAPLSPEDCQVQSMPDVSPAKWHLAHTSWFFETFLLQPYLPAYRSPDPAYSVLFNSYYVGVGERHTRAERGLISRPSLDKIRAYRAHVDAAMVQLMSDIAPDTWRDRLELGLHHEQQHQELILMDIQHIFSCNPLEPVYRASSSAPPRPVATDWIAVPGGLYEIGHDGTGFAFDNELPRHRIWLEPFEIADSLVTAAEYLRFIEDGGYARPELWLSDGWAAVESQGWKAPLYWSERPDGWSRFSLSGRRPLCAAEPVSHINFYEADAFARWAGCRLPREGEWEIAAGNPALRECFDCGWQWTASPYVAYPGYAPASGAIGEYNGKFMVNQMVLRGGSSATPDGHSRPTYRNFYPPLARWAFTGIRLAR